MIDRSSPPLPPPPPPPPFWPVLLGIVGTWMFMLAVFVVIGYGLSVVTRVFDAGLAPWLLLAAVVFVAWRLVRRFWPLGPPS